MNIEFKNTYEVWVMNPGDCHIEFQLSNYDTFKEFAEELKSHRIKWNKDEGCFNYRGEEEGLFFVISEKDYGAIADWCHGELEEYMNKHLSENWSEDAESTFFAPGLELEDAFNQLKKIDGVELELICEIEPGDYINAMEGPERYGKAWDKIQKVINSKQKSQVKSLTDHIKDTINDYKPNRADDYVDWDAVDKMLQGRK